MNHEIPGALIPLWVPLAFLVAAVGSTFVAWAIYAVLFEWYTSGIGRHRFCLYLSVLVALVLTLVNIFTGFYPGALIVDCIVFGLIAVVMVWAVFQMLRKRPPGMKPTPIKKGSRSRGRSAARK